MYKLRFTPKLQLFSVGGLSPDESSFIYQITRHAYNTNVHIRSFFSKLRQLLFKAETVKTNYKIFLNLNVNQKD